MALTKWPGSKKRIWGLIAAAALVVLLVVSAIIFWSSASVSMFIDPERITLEVGQTYSLQLTKKDGSKQDVSAKWSCDTIGVATVDRNGVVTAVGSGRAMVSAVVKKGGKEYVATAQVTVYEEGGTRVSVSGDKTQGPPDFRGEKFSIFEATDKVTYDMSAGTIQIPKSLKQSEIYFSNSRNYPCIETWDLQGTLTRSDLKDSCFLSVGVIDENGKEQWFCLYGTGLSRQRYWDWSKTKYDVDNVYVGFNKAAESFYSRKTADGNRLDFRVVLINDTLKVYFGNAKEPMALAWNLPLTQSTWGGFEKGSKYQLAINTVDPCDLSFTDVSCVNGEDVKDPGGIVGGKYADVKIKGDKFNIAQSSVGVSYNAKEGTARIQSTVKNTEMFFAGNENAYADRWEFSGTFEKEKLSDSLFPSFGVRDASGKTQWFCIFQNTLSLQKEWNWADTMQKVDGTYVKFNQAACSFFWKEKDQGAEKLHYKLILHHDVLTVYFGSDKHPMAQAWYLPLTMEQYGGFAAGSGYQIGIATVDPLNMDIKDIVVNNGDKAAQVPEFVENGKFVISGNTANVTNDPVAGTISVSDSANNSQLMFAADPYDVDNASWQLTGTVAKEDPTKNLFLSFGVRDMSGKEQWFCIYQKGLARQRNYNWADTAQPVDNVHVFANPASEHFFYKTPSLGGDKLHYAIIVENDVLKAYFGNDKYDMTLAWYIPLTEELWGGFAPGTQYQLGINSVDPCVQHHSNVEVVTGDAVNDIWAQQNLYNVDAYSKEAATMQSKLQQNMKQDVTTVFIGDSFFHQEAFFTTFGSLYRNKEAVCVGISTTNSYHWETFAKDWLKAYSPKNLVVNLGTNNLTATPPYNSSDNVIAALQSLLTLLKEQFPNTNIYWFSISPRSDLNREGDKAVINAAMKQWCEENGVTYVQSPITDPAADCVDGLHPTAATYARYAQALSDAGCEIVSKDTTGYQFFVDSASSGVDAKPVDGTITIDNSVSKIETMFAASADTIFDSQWQMTGTVTKQEMKNLFLSFGIRDEGGKEQWFCIYQKGLSRQRYYNWADTNYQPDGEYVIANPASEHFFYKTPSLGGDKLHFEIIVEEDVLKAYFGNDQYDKKLAWELPLTEELWGGFAPGTSYQLGINTVDPCGQSYTGVSIITGDAVEDTNGVVDTSNYKFFVDSATNGVTPDPEAATIQISNAVSQTETMFAASADSIYSDAWELTGTVTKNEMKNLFLSFGVRTESGKEQWFCIYLKGLARQRYWNWANTRQDIDNIYVFANPASEHFYYKTPSLGGDKLHFKIVIVNDVLKAYFGNDMYDMTLAWQLPLTEELWGGFASGSAYQLGINTVDPCSQSYTNVAVVTGEGVTDEDGGQEEEDTSLFYLDSATGGVTADPQSGTITISNSVKQSETMLKASADSKYATNWELTGTITKTQQASQFFSFGIRDENGKEQWLCIYQKGLARQRYWNWANTKQGIDDVYVFANPASEHFFYQTYGLGGDKLHFKIVIENDVFKAYFGSDKYEMTLAWQLPLTEELWGGFAPGTAYQLGMNSVDACSMVISNVQVTTSIVPRKSLLLSQSLALKPAEPEIPEKEEEQ